PGQGLATPQQGSDECGKPSKKTRRGRVFSKEEPETDASQAGKDASQIVKDAPKIDKDAPKIDKDAPKIDKDATPAKVDATPPAERRMTRQAPASAAEEAPSSSRSGSAPAARVTRGQARSVASPLVVDLSSDAGPSRVAPPSPPPLEESPSVEFSGSSGPRLGNKGGVRCAGLPWKRGLPPTQGRRRRLVSLDELSADKRYDGDAAAFRRMAARMRKGRGKRAASQQA
ncbi:hypothetical protein H632_c3157p1, partial [Helicosporidium sp. ATCC 50920]